MLVCVHHHTYTDNDRRTKSVQGMFICQLVVGVIVATCSHDWEKHAVAGWVAVVFVWLCKLDSYLIILLLLLMTGLKQTLPTLRTALAR